MPPRPALRSQAYGPAALTAGLTPGHRQQLAWWLGICSAWVAVLVVVGGITRLTRSGLSMTSWKFTGEKPPSTPVRRGVGGGVGWGLSMTSWKFTREKPPSTPVWVRVGGGVGVGAEMAWWECGGGESGGEAAQHAGETAACACGNTHISG